MIVPGRVTILFACVLALTLLAAMIEPLIVLVVIVADLILIAVCVIKGLALRRYPVVITRRQGQQLQVDREDEIIFTVVNRSSSPLIVRIRQKWPAVLRADQTIIELPLAAGELALASFRVMPVQRGTHIIPPADVDIRPLLDVARWRTATGEATIAVLPTMKGINKYEALRRHHAAALGGLHRQRMLGAGREFDQLRDYVPDDDFRMINWKATARHQRPITNVYQAERSRDVILCIDCGRMMGNPVGARTVLDHAVDASIMLAHVANRQGDRVGLALFRDVVHRFVKPAVGLSAVHRVIEELVDASAEPVFPSYAALIESMRAHQNRRSLMVLFTDLNDPQLAANLSEVLPLVSRKHVLVVITMRDPLLDRIAAGPAADRRAVYETIAARQLSTERATHVRELKRIGAMIVEADAGTMTMQLINTYLSIKTRQML